MKKLFFLLLVAALAGAGYYGRAQKWFGIFQTKNSASGTAPPSTALVEVRDIDFAVQVSGDVQPSTQLDVKGEVGGRVKALHVEPGDEVKAGQLLVEIDDRDILSELETSITEIEGAKLMVGKSQRNFERARELSSEKLISREAFDNLQSDLDLAKNSFTKAERKKQIVEDKLSKTKVLAPGNGTVLTVPVVQGQVVIPAASVNSGTTLMTIADLSKLLVETHVNQVDVAKLAPRQTVKLAAESIKDRQMDAHIVFIAPVATTRNNVKGFIVQALIEEPSVRLRPGMTVQLTIPIAHAEDAVTVPIGAVFKGDGNSRVVYVRSGDRTERRTVKVGISDMDYAEILDGLSKGEQILLNEPDRIARKRS